MSLSQEVSSQESLLMVDSVHPRGLTEQEVEEGWIVNDRMRQPVPISARRKEDRIRTPPKCGYCRLEGHNVLSCCPPEKNEIMNQVNEFTNIVDGPYVNSSRADMRFILKSILRNASAQRGGETNLSIYILYFVVLQIRNPISALESRGDSIKKIIHSILNIRTDKIVRFGNEEQRLRLHNELAQETQREAQIQQRRERINQIYYFYHNHRSIYRQFIHLRRYVNEEQMVPPPDSTNIASFYNSLEEVNDYLARARFEYDLSVQNFIRDYDHNPERLLFGNHIQSMRADAGFMDASIPVLIKNRTLVFPVKCQLLTEEDKKDWVVIECPVCYETIHPDLVCATNCFHKFCYHCISTVIKMDKTHRKCPCCRATIVEVLNKSENMEEAKKNLKDIPL